MSATTHLRVTTPQGEAGALTQEQGQFLFGYDLVSAAAAIKHSADMLKEVFFD